MEYEILITGIAGQGIQLAAKTLALAATTAGREVMMCPEYGGSMRGGSSLAQIAVGDRSLKALPVFHNASFALVVHDKYWDAAVGRLRSGATVLINSTMTDGTPPGPSLAVVKIPATQIATDVGSPNSGALVLVAAFAAATSIVSVDALIAAMADQVPPYRRQHVASNERAMRAGAEAAPALTPLWRVAPSDDAIGATR